ncbi:hypothetical protein B484DRAFT_464524 [Ochromonadaceae sp. CCMP2298]|nr:hypothetical protein B484DRAFT_464524 [Ochromonadaceae sp. CCMP2298]
MHNAYRGRDLGDSLPAAPALPPAQDSNDRRAPFTPAWRQRLHNSLDVLSSPTLYDNGYPTAQSPQQQSQASARAHQQIVHQQETARRQSILASAHQAQAVRQTASAQASIRQQQVERDHLSDQAPTATSALQNTVGPQRHTDEDESSEDEQDENVNEFKSYMIPASVASHIHERDNDAVICVDSGSGVHLDRKLRPDTVDSAVPNYDKCLTIKGIDGRSLKVTHHGYIPGRGLFVVCHQAAADLLSVTELEREGHEVKFKDGTVHITDSKGTQIMGYRAKDHLLYVMRTDIQTLRTTRPKRAIRGRPNKHWNVTGSDDIEDNVTTIAQQLLYTPQEQERARDVINIHESQHLGDISLCHALRHGSILGTPFTPRDVSNARAIYGPCLGCISGKSVSYSCPSSASEPASQPGQRLYADIIYIKHKTVGGYNFYIFAVCE